ncbi:dihydrofolate reductase [Gracilibacillus salitolerans]|uniref:Dihydrofolate reductase n=1 Tax=Gracilibacillus salitolerans TaxID=2663022 RepID=A0A5Q2TNA5_9BACI|nr:dihydrofolate reductase family protein [Gracilibacillus salitolerans]QGH35557.1 dihydrofolate reductase [Gracilibacillus salitolerans]
MRKIISQMMITVNGLVEGPHHELDWHVIDNEYYQYNDKLFRKVDTLLFGRVTFQHMEAFWQTPVAYEKFPETAERMNQYDKIVFSNTLDQVTWQNTSLITGKEFEKQLRQLKKQNGKDMLVLGSSDLVSALTEYGLVDEYHLIVNPVALAAGKRLWSGLNHSITLQLIDSNVFQSGNVLLRYHRRNHEYSDE